MQDMNKINILSRQTNEKLIPEVKINNICNEFIRLNKIILENNEEDYYNELKDKTKSLVTSISNDEIQVNYIITGSSNDPGIKVLYTKELKDNLKCTYGGINSNETSISDEFCEKLKYKAIITGIPFVENEEDIFSYSTFVNAMQRKNFALKICFKKISDSYVNDIYEKLVEEKTNLSTELSVSVNKSSSDSDGISDRTGESISENSGGGVVVASIQEGKSTSTDKTVTVTKTITEGKTYESKNYYNVEYDELLDIHIKRIKNMRNTAGYETYIIIYAESEEELGHAIDYYKSCFREKVLERFNYYVLNDDLPLLSNIRLRTKGQYKNMLYGFISELSNIYTVEELSVIVNPFWNEVNGFNVIKKPKFTQQFNGEKDIYIGNILNHEDDTNVRVSFDKKDFNKHVLVAGITGSGKTNTVFSLIRDLDVPFLVIEPAKTEYRKLKSAVKDLRVYTLGREQVSPFRLNPFKFEENNISLQEHIDNIKMIFNAAFTMYASMPNILEQCLVNIYTKKGWSLVTSKNIFCINGEVMEEYYPTIEDLYTEIDSYINSLGYAREQNDNIKAALLTRIKSMMTGSKGFMLNTSNSINIGELIKYPTVLELEGIADDEEKALIIGFIMLNIYEYLKAKDVNGTNELKHLIIMEEAHRIFSNTSSSENIEMVNTKGKSVETLSNILCEIRAYGEGFIIVDQVPTKLAPDVLKNTNIKIIHRLVSKDDCEYIAKSILIKERNIDFISRLKVGEALTFSDCLEDTAHIKINFNKDKYKYFSNKEVHEFSKEYNNEIFASTDIHPLTETLMSYEGMKNKIFAVSRNLIIDLFEKNIEELKSIYNESCKKYLDITYDNGFDINEDYHSFVDDIIKKSVRMIINGSRLSNNIVKSTFVIKYTEAFIHIAKLDLEKYEKVYKAFEKSRKSNYVNLREVLK